MEESASDIAGKNSILISRNHPVAIIVGAAGFIGSRLSEKLLELGVQVIGVDNLSTGRKENLAEAFKHKNFHFLHQSIEDLVVEENLGDLPQLDYAIFIAENLSHSSLYKNGLPNFLKIVKHYKKGEENSKTERPRVVFMSSIAVYDSTLEGRLNYLKGAENQFAKFIKAHGLNGRVVRLSGVFGPRMHFRQNDSLSRLIKLKLEGELNKDEGVIDFSTRSLFVDDAVSLILKSILSGSTSGKIFDGCLPNPVKIEEVKQILLNPDWYLTQGFSHTSLPPWPSPNLDHAIKDLSWKPKTNFIEGLKQTLLFFEADENAKNFALSQKREIEKEKIKGWSFSELEEGEIKKVIKKKKQKSFGSFFWPTVILLVFLFGLLYPIGSFLIGSFSLPTSLKSTRSAVERGDIVEARRYLEYAKISSQQASNLHPALIGMKNLGIGDEAKRIDGLLLAQNQAVTGAEQALSGLQSLQNQLENGGQGVDLFLDAQKNLANALTFYTNSDLQKENLLPNKAGVLDTSSVNYFYNLSRQGEKAEQILPSLAGKNYLLIVTDQGMPVSLGEINWQQESWGNSSSVSVADFDAQLAQKNILIVQNNLNTLARINNLESNDFPEFAQTLRNLDQSLNGKQLDGVVMMEKSIQQKMGPNFLINLELLIQALDNNHVQIFSIDPQAEKKLADLNWAGILNFTQSTDSFNDFLSTRALPITAAKYNLITNVLADGGIDHKLTLNYQSPEAKIVNLAVFSPLGSQLISAQLNGTPVQLTSSVDLGLAKLNGSINLNSGQNQLVVEYKLAKKLEMGDQRVDYNFKIAKQYGQGSGDFSWQLNYPFTWDLLSQSRGVDTTKHQINLQTNLDSDQSFDLSFKKH